MLGFPRLEGLSEQAGPACPRGPSPVSRHTACPAFQEQNAGQGPVFPESQPRLLSAAPEAGMTPGSPQDKRMS